MPLLPPSTNDRYTGSPLAPYILLLLGVLHALNGWIFTGGAVPHHPPEHYALLVALPLLVVTLVRSLAKRT